MRGAGLANDRLLPTCLTELTGFMPISITGGFSDDLHH